MFVYASDTKTDKAKMCSVCSRNHHLPACVTIHNTMMMAILRGRKMMRKGVMITIMLTIAKGQLCFINWTRYFMLALH